MREIKITPVFVENIPPILEQNKIYISEEYETSTHLCLCGCGEKVVLPFYTNARLPEVWKLTKNSDGSVSFSPSIGNYNYKCKSHYFISYNIATID